MAQILFLLVLIVIIVLLLGGSSFSRLPVAQARTFIKGAGLVAGILILLFLVSRGQGAIAMMLAPLLIPFLLKKRLPQNNNGNAPSPGQMSDVDTRFLKMHLDHDSGQMSGEIIDGPHSGATLDQLDQAALVGLWRHYCREDEQSAALMAAYLDRQYGPQWREEDSPPSAAGSDMSREEAAEILGVSPDAGEEEVRTAHKRMMQKNHPDQGGSTWLASKINQAKDVLLRG